jgi:hypothetical protein
MQGDPVADTRYLVHGVFWDRPAPAANDGGCAILRLQDSAGTLADVALDGGTRLGFRLAAAGKSCLGHFKVHGPADRDHLPCPSRLPASRGSQCEPCFVVDDSRLIHDFHRGGRVPPGLRSYRLLEDLVTRVAGLPQQIRSAAKAAGLVEPAAAVELDAINRHLAGRTRLLLAAAGLNGFTVVDERWDRPGLSDAACAPAVRHAYPHELSGGTHGFRIQSLSGSIALAALEGTELEFVVNLGRLKARTIELGDYGSAVPAVQEALF